MINNTNISVINNTNNTNIKKQQNIIKNNVNKKYDYNLSDPPSNPAFSDCVLNAIDCASRLAGSMSGERTFGSAIFPPGYFLPVGEYQRIAFAHIKAFVRFIGCAILA